MNAFVKWLKEVPHMTLMVIRSRTVLTALASCIVAYCIGKGWIPQNLFTQAADALLFAATVYFRVNATVDIKATVTEKSAVLLTPEPPPPNG